MPSVGDVATTYFMEIAEVVQHKMPYFRFWRLLKCVSFLPTVVLFDNHWTQILCEVDEQATRMPMSPSSPPH